jgi:UDPglucose 6-dehydrogenase
VRICVVGIGYVGLVSGACFAECGHEVTCVDVVPEKIAILNEGRLPLYEPGLAEIATTAMHDGRLAFSTDLSAGARGAEVIFVTVGTPSRPSDGHADLSAVYSVARAIAPALAQGAVIAIKSTVPVGTCDEVERIIRQGRMHLDFSVTSNPEFLRAGAAIQDFKRPDRIIIGGPHRACEKIAEVYRPFLLDETRIIYTGRRSAELIKYASNAFLATKIAYINEMADLCERLGADVRDVAHGMGLDARIGAQFLNAGPGFGGSCFPKDTLALIKMAEDVDTPMRIVESVASGNERRKRAMTRKIASAVGGTLCDKTIALLGLTFKPNTDDMRDAPSLSLIAGLKDMGAHVRAYDPVIRGHDLLPSEVICCGSPYEAAQGADVLVLVTEWEEFQALHWARLKRIMLSPVIFDLRRLYSAQVLNRNGFRYYGIGAPRRSSITRELPVQLLPARRLRGSVAEKDAFAASSRQKRQRRVAAAANQSVAPA